MGEKFERVEGETLEEYQMRLSVLKLVDGMDIDWTEIRDLLVGAGMESKHPDNIRKEGYAWVKAHKLLEKKLAEMEDEYYYKLKRMKEKVDEEIEDKRIKEINNKVLQLEKEKIKLKDQRNDLNAIKRTIARTEHLIECMEDKIDELGKIKPLLGKEVIKPINNTVGIAMISDIHLGVGVDNELSQYNPEICKEKMNYYINEVIKYGEFNNISELYVIGLGDYVTGIIRSTNRLEARLNVVQQVMTVSELLSEAIGRLSEHFICKVGLVQGNHDEIRLGDKDNTLIEESFTFFIDEYLKQRLKENKNIEFLPTEDREKEYITFKINGLNLFASHGQRDRNKQLDRTIEMFDEKIDVILRGHFHQPCKEYKNKTLIVTNGCWSGEPYSKRNRLYTPSVQKLLIFDEDGLVCDYDINLDRYNKEC